MRNSDRKEKDFFATADRDGRRALAPLQRRSAMHVVRDWGIDTAVECWSAGLCDFEAPDDLFVSVPERF
jgi:hypothetical protein